MAHHEADYFTSTIAYMVALAVMEIDIRVGAELDATVAALPLTVTANADGAGVAPVSSDSLKVTASAALPA